MVLFLNPVEFGADTDYQKQSRNQDDLEDLRKQVHSIDPEKEHPLQPHRGQTHGHTDRDHYQSSEVIPFGIRLPQHGQAEKHGYHNQQIKLRYEQSPLHHKCLEYLKLGNG